MSRPACDAGTAAEGPGPARARATHTSNGSARASTQSCAPSFSVAPQWSQMGCTESPSGAPQLPHRAVAIPRAWSVFDPGLP